MNSSGFRPGEDLAPDELTELPPAEPAGIGYTRAADSGGTDLDVLMGYQVLLGRDPENSFVIADAKSSPVGAFIRALISSGEFQSSVLDRLESGRPLPHETAAIAPSRAQLDWLFRFVTVPIYVETMLRSAPSWRDFLRVFRAVPGMPLPPVRAAAAAKPAEGQLPATEADEGFVLVNLENPKPTERLQPGSLVTGSGWTIAPADIAEIAILLDTHLLTHARYGLPRPDVARNFPHYRHVDHCGFAFTAEIPAGAAITPASLLIVRVRTIRGEEGTKTMRVQPPSAADAKSGATAETTGDDTWPMRLAIDEAVVDDGRELRLRGWAVARAGLKTLTAQLGQARLPEIRIGIARPDIAKAHPDYAQAGQAGFALVHELDEDIPAGPTVLRLQATDQRGLSRQTILPLTIPIPLWLEAGARPRPAGLKSRESLSTHQAPLASLPRQDIAATTSGIRLDIDKPELHAGEARETIRGAFTIAGWAVARNGIERIDVLCDGKQLGRAYLGMRREDIAATFSDFPDSLFAGFALVLPPGALPPGRHTLVVRATARKQGKPPPAIAEAGFLLNVADYDALPPGGDIRLRLPPAEAALGLALLDRKGARPDFDIAIFHAASSRDARADLAATLRSLSAQAYPHWTATVFMPEARLAKTKALPEAADKQGRIRFAAQSSAHHATQTKAPRYVLKLRPGDILGADALLELALASASDPGAAFIYSDEVRYDPALVRRHAFFKPDWSPTLLLSMNYIGRLWCATASLADSAGLSAADLGAASDYEAVLRLTEQAGRIVHVPRVLCARGEAFDTPAEEKSALAAALARRRVAATAEPGPVPGTWRIRRRPEKPGQAQGALPGPRETKGVVSGLVSVIMPTCSARHLVRAAIASVRATTAPARSGGIPVEIVIADNTPARDARARAWLRRNADTVIDMEGPFNWSRFNNQAAAAARGEYLLFLNDDIEVKSPDWLHTLLDQAQDQKVGIVGAKLLYPDGKVQHAGQYLAGGHARHAFRFAEGDSPGPFGLAAVAREMISVTGACQLMHRRVFERLGGFEEAHGIVNNDLDFCLRAWQAGLSVIYTPHAVMLHHELASRARLDDAYDEARFTTAWRTRFLLGDPFRNPNLARESDHYGAEQEPSELLHAGRRGPPLAGVKRILAIKLDHIGDFLTALPALRALKERFPQAAIDLLVPSASASLAAPGGIPDPAMPVENVLVFDFFHARSAEGQRSVAEADFAALHARLAPKEYDIAIDLRMHPETRAVLRHTGSAWLAGYDHQNRFPWLDFALEWEGDVRLVRKRAHVSERLVQLVDAAADACRETGVALGSAQGAASRPATIAGLPKAFLACPLVCIHPGVGNVVRQWPAASYAALIDLLAAEEGLHAVLIGAAEEAPIAERILRSVTRQGAVESLVGRVKLADLPVVMRACVLFVGNNSGPQHIAASLGLPTVGIHSGVVDAAEWAPLGAQAVAMRRHMVCSPCYLEFASDCPRELACLTGLAPRDVFAACRRLLAKQER
jgi:ADP-heptose:LPS heptosyltransferase/GT2 family glycosyltransferase